MSEPDIVDELVELIDRYHCQEDSAPQILSALTAVLAVFARNHDVELDDVLEATRLAWYSKAHDERPS